MILQVSPRLPYHASSVFVPPPACAYKYWTDLINDAVTGVKGTVNIMASDAQNVKQQLKVLSKTSNGGFNVTMNTREGVEAPSGTGSRSMELVVKHIAIH